MVKTRGAERAEAAAKESTAATIIPHLVPEDVASDDEEPEQREYQDNTSDDELWAPGATASGDDDDDDDEEAGEEEEAEEEAQLGSEDAPINDQLSVLENPSLDNGGGKTQQQSQDDAGDAQLWDDRFDSIIALVAQRGLPDTFAKFRRLVESRYPQPGTVKNRMTCGTTEETWVQAMHRFHEALQAKNASKSRSSEDRMRTYSRCHLIQSDDSVGQAPPMPCDGCRDTNSLCRVPIVKNGKCAKCVLAHKSCSLHQDPPGEARQKKQAIPRSDVPAADQDPATDATSQNALTANMLRPPPDAQMRGTSGDLFDRTVKIGPDPKSTATDLKEHSFAPHLVVDSVAAAEADAVIPTTSQKYQFPPLRPGEYAVRDLNTPGFHKDGSTLRERFALGVVTNVTHDALKADDNAIAGVLAGRVLSRPYNTPWAQPETSSQYFEVPAVSGLSTIPPEPIPSPIGRTMARTKSDEQPQ